MGKWSYSWFVEYYRGQWLEHKYVDAKNREEAISKVRKTVPNITEIKCCVRAKTLWRYEHG